MSEALSAEMRRCGAFEWAAKLEALEEKVQYAANAATDLARQLRVAEARIEALEPLARYGEAQLHREYEDEAGIESILSATRGIPSAHRSFDAFKVKKLAALAAKEKEKP